MKDNTRNPDEPLNKEQYLAHRKEMIHKHKDNEAMHKLNLMAGLVLVEKSITNNYNITKLGEMIMKRAKTPDPELVKAITNLKEVVEWDKEVLDLIKDEIKRVAAADTCNPKPRL